MAAPHTRKRAAASRGANVLQAPGLVNARAPRRRQANALGAGASLEL
jgi:hypothetical protein